MKLKSTLLLLIFASTLGMAQTEPTASLGTQNAQDPVPVTIVGCLEGMPGSFLLIDNSGRIYNLAGDGSALWQGLHAQVEVKGTIQDPNGSIVKAQTSSGRSAYVSESTTNAGTKNTGAGASANGNTLVNVTSAKQVAPDCDNFN